MFQTKFPFLEKEQCVLGDQINFFPSIKILKTTSVPGKVEGKIVKHPDSLNIVKFLENSMCSRGSSVSRRHVLRLV